MLPDEARARFDALVALPEDEIDLLRAALAIAAEEDAGVDIEQWAHRIDGLAHRGLTSLTSQAGEQERLDRLFDLFFDELGFTGDGTDFEDPASSFLPAVVERRRGLPIALSVLFVRIGRTMGLSCAGVGFPGHFLARVTTSEGEIFIDPFARCRSLSAVQLAARLKGRPIERWMLAASPPGKTLARMLRNLKALYMRKEDHARAFGAVDKLVRVEPDAWEDLRDRGLLCARLGGVDAARRDLRSYLEHAPEARDAGVIRARLEALRQAKTLLN